MSELILTLHEARKHVELIGDKIPDSITFEPIFLPGSKIIALVTHRALGKDECFDTVFVLRKTDLGVKCQKILDTRAFILVPAKKKMISIESVKMTINNLIVKGRIDTSVSHFEVEFKYYLPLDILFAA